MLDESRIKEAGKNVKNYLEEGLLKKTNLKEGAIKQILIANSRESLKVADTLFSMNLSSLWVIVSSYYAMFYITSAVLYELGYKIEHKIPHKIAADSLVVFVRSKLKDVLIEEYEEAQQEALELSGTKADELIESFDFERVKRSRFQYSMTETSVRSRAKTSLERAKKFIFEMEKLLQ